MADRLTLEERAGTGVVAVMARKGVAAHAIGEALGDAVPSGPGFATTTHGLALGVGPGTWLVMRDDAGPDHAETLGTVLAGLASISDQSGAYRIIRLSGPDARTVLQRGASIDFHPEVFGPGSSVVTVIAHIGAIVWQVDDLPTYDIAVYRSFYGSFRHWIDTTIATP